MSFQSNHNKNHDSGSFWTSYSDLFLGMSVIFLLLYVTASLRTGTNGLQSEIENKKLSQQVEDLKNQIKAYDSIKNEYLKSEASPQEEKQYNELMDKLSLLREEAKDEKDKLAQASLENDKKEKALNQYQQMIRNMINANMAAKTKIKTREVVIGDQDTELKEQSQEINTLKSDVEMKQEQIAQDEHKLNDLQSNLQKRLQELKSTLAHHKMTQAAYEKKTQALKQENQRQLSALQSKISTAQQELDQKAQELNATRSSLSQAELDKQALAAKAAQEASKAQALQGELGTVESKHQQELAAKAAAAAARERELADKMQQELGSAEAKHAKELADKQAAANARERQLGDKLHKLGSELKDTEGLLAAAKAEADARKQIAKDIKDGFAKAGISADVNPGTGEVIINFGKVYFDNGSAKLKEQMKAVLQKAMPVYSKSLLGNPKVGTKINAVEIIGFASPTYKGKYVDPKKLDPGSRAAINYNLDLSYARARSIFDYVFDESNMQFTNQKKLLPLIKVTGRSFFAEGQDARNPAKADATCSTPGCKESQRVIIRFSFDDKK